MSPPNVCRRLYQSSPRPLDHAPAGGSTPPMTHQSPSQLWLDVAKIADEVEQRLATEAKRAVDEQRRAAEQAMNPEADAA
jgi:hypothetical protein